MCLAVEPHTHHAAVEDQPNDVLVSQIAPRPSFPIDPHLAPYPADDVFADGTLEQRCQHPLHPPGIDAGEEGVDQQTLTESLMSQQMIAQPGLRARASTNYRWVVMVLIFLVYTMAAASR